MSDELLTASALAAAIDALADPVRAATVATYLQTGPGQYGEGDVIAGVTVPQVRALVRRAAGMPPAEASVLLDSPVHEHRAAALLVLVARYQRASRVRTRDDAERAALHARYLDAVRAGRVDNWDLVDSSAEWLVGDWLLGPPAHDVAAVLDPLASSSSLWQRRVAMLATFAFTKAGDPGPALTYAARLLGDRADLVHKAVGWMLREVGKRVSRATLLDFLEQHAARMPRTALSYATEHLDPAERARLRAL
ncbi:DNA alkylation repair protein [Xylanimonas protaetiae]|uniref:DNA alkylation repair protein n=1 Tax=Xylanimonas protaetiae TaxID=2509457 RepID=A0A4P6F5N8_9MICO|nr:DNA alkylation repair protein [Xylanimonas protaetiae]QAY71032.1 DNA alkylation repair protein [Xylanimonas protaetiae]